MRRFDVNRGLRFLAMIEAMKPLRIVSVGARQHRAGTELLRKFSDQRLTLADAVGLHVMEERKITMLPVVDETRTLRGLVQIHDLWGTHLF